MWNVRIEVLETGRIRKLSIRKKEQPLSYEQTIRCWQHDAGFRTFFIALLADAPFPAYFWETPPVTVATVSRPFEFVLVDSPSLAGTQPDPSDFESHFAATDASEEIATFSNLGKDAFLIAPGPRASQSAYPHLAAFSRLAPVPQQQALWHAVGAAVEQRLNPHPLWLSTSGLSVAWLHVRLDSRPKYYTFAPYRQIR
jgi:hypothetical protein